MQEVAKIGTLQAVEGFVEENPGSINSFVSKKN